MVNHFQLTRQERSQIAGGRWMENGGPLCGTGDGHYVGTRQASKVGCPACLSKLSSHYVRSCIDYKVLDYSLTKEA